MLHDPKSGVFNKFGVEGWPTNIVIDRKGKVVYAESGGELKDIEAAVTKALGM